ncbi:MAG: phytanoyl-CoA dioxygenase family protein [Gemmatimonadaceae bacterium]|nr:phytanoyl-CoA dioxygenase family protein [Gemmatimonadaceae bacterium]
MTAPLPALRLEAAPDLAGRERAVREQGFAYLPALLDADRITALREAMDRAEPLAESFDRLEEPPGHPFYHKVINNAFNRDLLFLSCLDFPEVIELAEALHGGDCHVIGMTAWLTGPGRPDQGLHADWQPLTLPEDVMDDPRVQIPVFITTAHFYLDDLTEELGPTVFVPGSHRAGRPPDGDRTWRGTGEHSILCRAGDVVVFRSEVWHRGTANRSDRVRYLLQVHYARRMITQKYPPYLNRFRFDPAILEQATPRQRRLMGDHRPSNYD